MILDEKKRRYMKVCYAAIAGGFVSIALYELISSFSIISSKVMGLCIIYFIIGMIILFMLFTKIDREIDVDE